MSKIDILKHDALSVVAMNAIAAVSNDDGVWVHDKFNISPGDTNVEITILINGIEIPFEAEFGKALESYLSDIDRRIEELMLEKIKDHPLGTLLNTLNTGEWSLREAMSQIPHLTE